MAVRLDSRTRSWDQSYAVRQAVCSSVVRVVAKPTGSAM